MNVQLAPTAPVHKTADEPNAPDVTRLNLFRIDKSLQHVLRLRLAPDLLTHLESHFGKVGARVACDLDANARLADRHPPVLDHATAMAATTNGSSLSGLSGARTGRLRRFRPSGDVASGGVLGWKEPLPPIVKYALTYLFAEAEFGLLCPINMTDSLTRVLRRFANDAILQRYFPA